MNLYYKNIVKLLLDTLPFVFSDETFVLKGGTAINLFYRNLPRLSVDIDLAYAERKHDRETKTTFNIGADFGFFANRLMLTAEYYYSKTSDMLYAYEVPVPPFTYNTLLANIGFMSNRGFEIGLSVQSISKKDMELNINMNLSFQSNKLISLSGDYKGMNMTAADITAIGSLDGAGQNGGDNNVVYQIVGQPLGVFYLPHCKGLVKNENGSYSYDIEDLDHNGKVDLSDGGDRYIAGQATPKVTLGSNISFRYKDFYVALQMNGAFGHKIFNGTGLAYTSMACFPDYNVLKGAPQKNITNQRVSDYWLEKGDYLNFEHLTIGYNEPLKSNIIRSLRVSCNISNLGTITGYKGLTPMINSYVVNSTMGIDDKRNYPLVAMEFLKVVQIDQIKDFIKEIKFE